MLAVCPSVTDKHMCRPTSSFQEFTRQLIATDLARFRLYAERVLTVGVWYHSDRFTYLPDRARKIAITSDNLQELGRVATVNGWRLLPNVKTLVYKESDVEMSGSLAAHVPHLLGPQLRQFKYQSRLSYVLAAHADLPHVEGMQGVTTMFAALQQYAPQLVELAIHIDRCSRPIVEAIWDVVLACRDLISLEIDQPISITPAALRHLARILFLERLSFASTDKAFTKQEIKAFHRDLPPSETFPRLRRSSMALVNLDLAYTFVRHVSSPYLEGLEIEVSLGRRPVPSSSVPRFFRAFPHLPRISAFKSLHVRFNVYRHDNPAIPPDPITQELLRPFLGSSRIEKFELVVGCPFALDDAFIEEIVRAWPNIEDLRLGACYPRVPADTPAVTWNSIITMARGWPLLQELSIEFDTDVSRVSPATRKKLRESNSANQYEDLRTLVFMDVGCSKIDDEMAIAALMSELFTPLAEVNSAWEELARQEQGWEELRMEREGDAFQPDPELETRVAQYMTYCDRWLSLEEPMDHLILIRWQEWNWQHAGSVSLE